MSCKGLTGQKLKDCQAKAKKKTTRANEQKETNKYVEGSASENTVANLNVRKPKVPTTKPETKPKTKPTVKNTGKKNNILAFGGSVLSQKSKKRRMKKKGNRLV